MRRRARPPRQVYRVFPEDDLYADDWMLEAQRAAQDAPAGEEPAGEELLGAAVPVGANAHRGSEDVCLGDSVRGRDAGRDRRTRGPGQPSAVARVLALSGVGIGAAVVVGAVSLAVRGIHVGAATPSAAPSTVTVGDALVRGHRRAPEARLAGAGRPRARRAGGRPTIRRYGSQTRPHPRQMARRRDTRRAPAATPSAFRRPPRSRAVATPVIAVPGETSPSDYRTVRPVAGSVSGEFGFER